MAAITSYLDIITLERAKNYLRIDDTLSEDDLEITSMIKAAFLFMERYTNHIFMPKDFVLLSSDYCDEWQKCYNFPITAVTPLDTSSSKRPLYTSYYVLTDTNVTITAGYVNTEDVPDDFIQAALQILKVFYFEAEKQVNESMIPMSVKQVLDSYRRFV